MFRLLLLPCALVLTLLLSAQEVVRWRVSHRARLTTTDGPVREQVLVLAADSAGLWVAPRTPGRSVDMAALTGNVRFVPVADLQDLRMRKRNGVVLGFLAGGAVGYILGAEVGKATSGADSTRAAAGVAGGLVGLLVLAPVGAVAGLFPARYPVGGSAQAYTAKLAVLRQRSLFKDGLPAGLRP